MPKKLLFFIVILFLLLVGCNTNDSDGTNETAQTNETTDETDESDKLDDQDQDKNDSTQQENKDGEKEDVKLQVLKADEEAGATIEDNPIYSGIQSMIDEDLKLGTDGDFSVHTANIFHAEDGSALVLIGVNRIGTPIKNVSFNVSIGEEGGSDIWENTKVDLPEKQAGVIQSNSAVPFIMNLTDEKEEKLKKLDQDNLNVEVDDFDYEEAN